SKQYSTSNTKKKDATYEIKWIEDMVPIYGVPESTKDVYSRKRIIAVNRLKILKRYDYGHLDEIELANLMIDERSDLNVALHMFTRRIVIQRRVKDLQLGESYGIRVSFKECSKVITKRLDCHIPEGKSYLFDLQKPLSLIPDHRGRQVIPQDYFINNDLEYLKGGSLSKQYSTSNTKKKDATYEIKWIEDMVPIYEVP
nr:hypothetical protein [Tanacetum cinerariifolium]